MMGEWMMSNADAIAKLLVGFVCLIFGSKEIWKSIGEYVEKTQNKVDDALFRIACSVVHELEYESDDEHQAVAERKTKNGGKLRPDEVTEINERAKGRIRKRLKNLGIKVGRATEEALPWIIRMAVKSVRGGL